MTRQFFTICPFYKICGGTSMGLVCKMMFVWLALLSVADAARILGVFTVPSYSHQIVFEPIWLELAKRGHDLVIVTPKVVELNLTNVRQIDVGFTRDMLKNQINFSSIFTKSGYDNYATHMEVVMNVEEAELRSKQFQELLKEKPKFDLIMVQWMTHTLLPLGAYFNAPVVGVSSLTPYFPLYHSMGNPPHPVSHPDFLTCLPSTPSLTFFERLHATSFSIFAYFYQHYRMIPRVDSIASEVISPNLPSVSTLQHNLSALFVQYPPLFATPRPNLPNIIQFSGLHLQKPKPLPIEVERFLNAATRGVVYVSLGSNVNSASLPISQRNALVQAFSSLPYEVLWKFEDATPEGLGPNVYTAKWLPQQDILRHKNVKAFVTQGGAQSLEEAVDSGIPIIGFPIFSDQPRNIRQAELAGVGLSINPQTVTAEQLKNTIREVVENPKYRAAMQKISKITADQQVNHLENIVWWIEYIIRHKGAPHLRGPYPEIPWWKFYFVDQILFIIGIFAIGWRLIKLLKNKIKEGYEKVTQELKITVKSKTS